MATRVLTVASCQLTVRPGEGEWEVTMKREKASDFGAGTTLVTGALAETARLSGQDTGVRKALQSNVTLVLCDMPSREKILE